MEELTSSQEDLVHEGLEEIRKHEECIEDKQLIEEHNGDMKEAFMFKQWKQGGNHMEKEPNSITLTRVEKPSSYEFGRAGNRFKLYFNTPEELKAEITKLTELGLYSEVTE